MRKAALLMLGFVAVLTLVPGSSSAGHCSDVFIFSGPVRLPDNPATTGLLNAGAGGCQAEALGASDVDTNLLTPGATVLVVGATDLGPAPSNGLATFDNGDTAPLTFTFQETATGATRWVSQAVDIPADATSVTASARVGGTNQSVTYARTA